MKAVITCCTLLTLAMSFVQPSDCSCIPNRSIKEQIESTKFIFTGNPIFKDTIGAKLTLNNGDTMKILMVRITFIVQTPLKGKFSSDTVQVITGTGSGDCGYHFINNEKYIVFCNSINIDEYKLHFETHPKNDNLNANTKEYLTTSICTLTGKYDKGFESEIIAQLKSINGS